MKKYDVIVCGGGLSGIAAAIAAARENIRVLLVEKYAFTGGMATAGLVNPFSPYNSFSKEHFPINRGIFYKILENLESEYGLHPNKMTFNESVLQYVLDAMLIEAGVNVLFHSLITDVKTNGRNITEITVSNKSGNCKYSADYFVDATGDADVSAMSGCEFRVGRDEDGLCQPMTLCFRIGGIDKTKLPPDDQINKKFNEFQEKGVIKNTRENILIFPHMQSDAIHFNTTRIVKKSPLDAEDLTKVELEARSQMRELFRFLKENIPGYENAHILNSATLTGVRESRRIVGLHTITADEIVNCTKFEDSIARGNYPIDIHNPSGGGTVMKHIDPSDYYTIPYRALVPKDMDNLIVCGRPISSTHEAHSAYRVMPICCNIGEGAGIAASIAKKKNLKFSEVDSSDIQAVLKQNGGLY